MRAGYAQIAPPVLQPAEPFLDLSGEDIRRRMFLTTDPDGRELCLRPDLTIPVSRDYLASPAAGKPAGFCYLGAVFRHRDGAAAEFLQAGIESFGRADKAAADAEMLALGLEATTQYGVDAPEIRMGDVGLFAAFIAALDLAPVWKRRLVKDFNRKSSLAHDLDQLTLAAANGSKEYQGVLAALAGSDPKAAHHLVTDLLSIAGIAAVGGRSVAEIADRFLEQSALNAPTRLPRDGFAVAALGALSAPLIGNALISVAGRFWFWILFGAQFGTLMFASSVSRRKPLNRVAYAIFTYVSGVIAAGSGFFVEQVLAYCRGDRSASRPLDPSASLVRPTSDILAAAAAIVS